MTIYAIATETSEAEGIRFEEVKVLVGEEVYCQLEEEGFCAGWDALYDACPWGTVFQSRAFVSAWYSVYRERQLPVLVKAEQDGQLVGLLTLTRLEKGSVLLGAGGDEAGYHVWLSEAFLGEEFATKALARVRAEFPDYNVVFNEIPPHTPLAWVERDPVWRSRCAVQALTRPLMDLRAPDAERLVNSNGIKGKVNRLKRLGEFSFERITDYGRFAGLLDELNSQFDFRKAAMLNITPFRSEPLRKQFQLALFKQGLLYVTVMSVNGEVVASNTAMVGRERCLNGVWNTHAPAYGKYSPGIVSFLLLGQQLLEEGVEVYDLTTGGHGYKERLANAHDQVYILTVGNSYHRLINKLKALLLQYLKGRVQNLGVASPRVWWFTIKVAVIKNKARLRLLSQQGFWGLVHGLLQERAPERVYRLEGLLAMAGVQVCGLSELLCFDERGGLQTRWDFLGEAERRLQVGERCFGLVEDGVLLCCAWLGSGEQVLTGLYCHRSGLGLLAGFLGGVRDRSGEASCVAVSDPGLQRALEGAGLRAV